MTRSPPPVKTCLETNARHQEARFGSRRPQGSFGRNVPDYKFQLFGSWHRLDVSGAVLGALISRSRIRSIVWLLVMAMMVSPSDTRWTVAMRVQRVLFH